MDLSSLGSSTSSLTAQAMAARAARHHGSGGPLDAAATALGLSKDDLISRLKSGRSLDDVATTQGVSHADLAAAIKAGMPSDLASSPKADAMVESIISKKGMPDALPAQRPAPLAALTSGSTSAGSRSAGSTSAGSRSAGSTSAGSTSAGGSVPGSSDVSASGVYGSSLTDAQQSTLDALSGLLGTDSDSLLDSLKSGSSTLADLISAKGVDQSSLASILQDGLLFDATV